MDVQLPKYYQETYFAKDSLLHPEVSGAGFGVAGDPVPYTVRHDNLITGMLLLCFVLTLVIYSHFRKFIARQYKVLVMPPRGDYVDPRETPSELRTKILMALQTCLLFSIVAYFMMREYKPGTMLIDSDLLIILLFLGILIVYALLKYMLYSIANNVFFDSKRNRQLLRSLLLVAATQGVFVLPVVLLLVYFGLSLKNVLYYLVFVVVICKLLTFHRAHIIFFRQKGGFLQNILYFCALEIVPLAVLMGTWVAVVDLLKVNF